MITMSGMKGWPTTCRVCHRWQRALLCTACLHGIAPAQPRCDRCALPLSAPGRCHACEDDPPPFDHALALMDYVPPWSALVAALKFQDDLALATLFGALLAERVKTRWANPAVAGRRRGPGSRVLDRSGAPDAIVPVPLGPERLRERGYNQAALVARAIARQVACPMVPDALQRRRDTVRLMTLDADERLRQIRGAFAVNPRCQTALEGRHVALVDDVLTTGATLGEAARTLWHAGAREVSVWVVARTPSHTLAARPSPWQDQPAWQDTELMPNHQ